MKLLAFDTGTEHLSIAVCRDGDAASTWFSHEGAGGPQASVALIPAIQSLLAQAGLRLDELDAIAFGAGPGSFTGLRTACAVAQGLGYGAGVPLLAVDSLLALAEDARHSRPPALRDEALDVLALLDARMGEVYAAGYRWAGGRWLVAGEAVACPPQALAGHAAAWALPGEGAEPGPGASLMPPRWVLAGNAWAAYGERLLHGLPPTTAWIEARPRASALLRLAPSLLAAGCAVPPAQALPRYIRDKVAQTTDERAASKAALSSAPAAEAPVHPRP